MKQVKVLYISHEAGLRGAVQSLLNMLKAAKNFVEVVVVIPRKGMIEEKLKELNVSYYIIPFTLDYGLIGTGTQEKADSIFFNNYSAALKLRDIIVREEIDIIHTNSSVSNVGIFASVLTEKPHVWHFREFVEEDFSSEFYDKELKKQLFQASERIVSISDCVQKSYKSKYGLDTIRIYNGLDIDSYLQEVQSENRKREIIFAGQITEEKGQWDAIKAVELLVREGITDIKLTLIGMGNDKIIWTINKYIEKKGLAPYIEMVGFQKNISKWRKKSMISITGSRMEALGRTTIEAMLAGDIVIGTNSGGTAEIIGSDRGFTYEYGNSEQLASAIKKVLCMSQAEKADLVQRAQKYAITTFNLEKYADAIERVYEAVLDINKNEIQQRKKYLKMELEARYRKLSAVYCKTEKKEDINDLHLVKKNQHIEEAFQQTGCLQNALKPYFKTKGYKSAAIYGMGHFGCMLYDELVKNDVKISYVMDQKPQHMTEFLKVINPDKEMDEVDVIIVSVVRDEEKLVDYLKSRCTYSVVGITELVDELAGLFLS